MAPLTFNNIALGVGSGFVGGAKGPLLPLEQLVQLLYDGQMSE